MKTIILKTTIQCAIALLFSLATLTAQAVDINSATADELASAIKGVGKKQAAAIVEYRTANGPFKSADELVNVPGIGQKTVDNNRAVIEIGRASQPASSTAASNQAAPQATAPQATAPQATAPQATAPQAGAVDINSASADEIAAALKGVGAKQAAAIVEYRAANGPFSTLEDLANVKGIGPKTLANNQDKISFGGIAKAAAQAERTAKADSPRTTTQRRAAVSEGAVNINTASQEELESLTGIGPVKAAKIIAYREQNGPFQTVEDLTKVSGVGAKTLAKNLDRLTVD